MRVALALACLTLALSTLPGRATIYTDGLLMEPENQTIQDLREMRRQEARPADPRQHDVRIAAGVCLGAAAAAFGFYRLRRR